MKRCHEMDIVAVPAAFLLRRFMMRSCKVQMYQGLSGSTWTPNKLTWYREFGVTRISFRAEV